MKILTKKSTQSRKNILCAFLFFIFILSANIVLAQFKLIVGVKYNPWFSFSKFDNNQYVSHAWKLRPLGATNNIVSMPYKYRRNVGWLMPSALTLRIGGLRITKVIDMDIEIGRGVANVGYKRKIIGNYIGNHKRRNELVSESGMGFRYYPINFYFLTKPTTKNFRKFIKIGTALFTIPKTFQDGYFYGESKFVYPDANPSKQDTLVETEYSYYVKPFPKVTINTAVGIEKILLRKIVLDFALVYNQGFSTMIINDVEYTIKGETFKNRILNKGTYLGIELNIGINPFYRKPKK